MKQYDNAIIDGVQCVQIAPDNYLGYLRVAEAKNADQDHNEADSWYRDAFKKRKEAIMARASQLNHKILNIFFREQGYSLNGMMSQDDFQHKKFYSGEYFG